MITTNNKQIITIAFYAQAKYQLYIIMAFFMF